MPAPILDIFVDGACKGNPGIGGWGVLMRYGQHEKVLMGAQWHTTNNRMELTAAIEALKAIKRPCPILISTDSVYVKNGITHWLPVWKKNNWRNASKKPIKNIELWQALDQLNQRYEIEWRWVKGHAGNPGNEIADELANRAIESLRQKTS
ncbi:ribonuclease HI [Dichelobacter nodosus]|uniref:Ribonuclease H n=1 Tax=Dichelobacter nodosus (strain VCS1703A) TaxID=246195 RepID=RNH_DICNV|nr:ribonuclease HI [Dichelobacter nodosus]A5EXP9.1 RecName: Full=Ribonuclease H; Short=RNase H [Dichelobacter nodosus VCS1703A]ABQ14019.1 RNase H [Dichelobacter nodosus VCS1703A]KNZ39045.1 ribonuclease H [Dichelobacter nodosus]TGA64668.1 ribonuclease HI [Dichelobacter nodosus]